MNKITKKQLAMKAIDLLISTNPFTCLVTSHFAARNGNNELTILQYLIICFD